MNDSQAKTAVSKLEPSHLYAVIHGLAGGRPNPEDDNPPGPWDPIIRIAIREVERMGPQPEPWKLDTPIERLGPFPQPWRSHISERSLIALIARRNPEIWDIIGGPLTRIGLNPQPLPPRYAFIKALGEAVIERAEIMQELGEAMNLSSDRGIIVVGGRYINRFLDDICPPFPRRPKFPKPWPPPPDWFPEEMDWMDYIVLGSTFDLASQTTFNESLKTAFGEAAEKIAANAMA